MHVMTLRKERSLAEIVTRAYGLAASDPRSAAAQKALAAANPHLQPGLATLPPGTPIVVPAVAGATVSRSAGLDPRRAALVGTLGQLVTQARAAMAEASRDVKSNTQAEGTAFASLQSDVAAFTKLHGG